MDPYREWLGIDGGGGPMTAYRLLGLRPFEADPHAICQAIARARRLLEPHQRGRSAGPCRQLLDQVARVEKVLTDPARKQSYDHGLRAKLGDSAGSVGGTPAKGSGGSGRAACLRWGWAGSAPGAGGACQYARGRRICGFGRRAYLMRR